LPKGGGAPRGLDASVPAPGFRGTARVNIPIDLPPARGAAPSLTLVYDSSGGNGPFGAGAGVALPSVALSTATGIPTYTDRDPIVFSEVGLLAEKGSWVGGRWVAAERTAKAPDGDVWRVREYVPRLQGAFPLIERWTRVDDRVSHWRVVSADNVESRFGVSAEARIANPDDPCQVYEWLLEDVTDANGNRAIYRYKAEDDAGARPRPGTRANRYIERILYGNHPGDEGTAFAFEIVFDYGEYDLENLHQPDCDPYLPVRPWPAREDGFSSYRLGFDLRTDRLCRSVLTFHRFPAELGPRPCLTAATRFDYTPSPYLSCLRAVTRTGYRRQPDGSYRSEALPPVELGFTSFDPPPAPAFRRLEVEREDDLPDYLAPGAYQPVDLDGEGIPGFLQSNGAVTLYYAPLGEGRYAAARSPTAFPNYSNLANPRLALADIDGDGRTELLVTAETESGFFRHRDDGGWSGFQSIGRIPTTDESPSAEFVDLTGDGLADAMTLGRTAVQFYPSLGELGFGPMRAAARRPDFPSAAANSGTARVTFADIFGDGLSHRVRVTDGEVAVWPNIGHGRFGARLTLPGAPSFGDDFSASRCYFADIDGTGTADLVVAASDRILVYRNESGNGFSPPLAVPLPFRLGAIDQLSFGDILGNATTAIIATRASPAVEHWFCDLAAPAGGTGRKPFLLVELRNGTGATTEISYRSSASFFLADKREGRVWPTRMPSPVQLVETLAVTDHVTGARTLQRFRYHDGYYDGLARTFRGFGYVESWHRQFYAPFAPAPAWPVERVNADLEVTPGYGRTWYSTGAYFQSAALERQYAGEFYAGDPAASQIPPSRFDPAVLAAGATLRQAYAALAGRPIRSETYADEGAAQASATPYKVTAASYDVQLAQPAGPRGAASLLVRDREAISYDYERDAADPRVRHEFLLAATLAERDGAPSSYERRCSVCYGRRTGAGRTVYPEQQSIKASLQEEWSTFVTEPFRRIGTPYEQRELDLGGLAPPQAGIYTFAEIEQQAAAALEAPIPYGQAFAGDAPQSRPTLHVQRYFWDEPQAAPLGLGGISARALLHHEQKAVFSETWRAEVYGDAVTDADLTGLAGLVDGGDGYWWNPGLVLSYFPPDRPDLFFLPCGTDSPSAVAGPFAKSTTRYDSPYALLPVEVAHYAAPAVPVATAGRYDYQALQPARLTDPNGVVQQALYDPLGRLLVSSLFKPASGEAPRVGNGDLADYVVAPGATFDSVLADPTAYLQQAGAYYFYDLHTWSRSAPRPAASIALLRTRFVSDGVADAPIEISIQYSDSFGRPAEGKRACEPEAAGGAERWLASGRTVYDGDGQTAQAYLPFYAPTPDYEPQQALADAGLVPPPRIELRDPIGRAVRVATPKGFFTRAVYGAWQTVQYDEDDTILDAPFYVDFMAHYPEQPTQAQQDEKAALDKAAAFYNTPSTAILDNAGRTIRQIRDNLGDVPPDYFAAIVGGDVTSEQLWSALITAGYLENKAAARGASVTANFQPYTSGFKLTLPAPFDAYAAQAAALLTQSCLTTLFVLDSAGRLAEATDPRLFLAEVQGGTAAWSARFAYPMGSETAALSDSADAGERRQLASYLDPIVLSFDAMGRRQQQDYDGLQRLVTTIVTEPGGTASTTQALTYGEGRPDAAASNLAGEVWKIEDEAGVLLYPGYTILGQATQLVRTFASDYKVAPDWSQPVTLQPQSYATAFTYDALGRVLTETLPDTSLVARGYWPSGRLATITVTLPGGTAQPFVGAIGYAADDSRTRVAFGNQVVQSSGYEATTGRLLALAAERPAGETRDPTLQSVAYTYDPVGNVSIVRDRTAQLLFGGGTQPEALGDFGYDALYNLVSASGLQHPGIEADTHVTGFMQSLYAELCPKGAPPIALETYAETYGYDLSGNLVSMHHQAASASFDRETPVDPLSNRLAGVPYDANGNALAAELTGTVPLAWGPRNLLARTGPFERPDGRFDQDYDVYDFFGQRVRRVVETGPAASAPPETITERLVVGAYLLSRTTDPAADTTEVASALRILDGSACLAVADTLGGGAPELRYQLDDRLGSISVETGQDAGILSYEAYYPFGGTAIVAGSDPAVVARKLLRYSGKRSDEDTGFYDYGARRYLPWQSRWLSADPSGTIDGLNLFRFVRNNPLTFADPDGRNPWDPDDPDYFSQYPGLPASFWISFSRSAIYSAVNAPRQAFYLAPISLMRRISGSESERARDRNDTLARREELRILFFAFSRSIGYDPERYLPPTILPYVRPRAQPWASTNIPIYGNPLQREIRSQVFSQDFIAGTIGGATGSFLVVGGTLAIARSLAFPRMRGPTGALAGLVTFGISQYLATIGQAEEYNQVYRDHQAQQAKLWFWSRSYKPALSGVPRRIVQTEHVERGTAALWNENRAETLVAIAVIAALYRMYGPRAAAYARQSAGNWWRGSGGSGVIASAQRRLLLPPPSPHHMFAQFLRRGLPQWAMFLSPTERRMVQLLQARLQQQNRQLVPYREVERALVPRPANALTVVDPTRTALQRYTAPPAALQPYRRQPAALVPYRPQPSALIPYRPQPSSLMPYGMPSSLLSRNRVLALAGIVGVTGATLLYGQQNRTRNSGND
jgi:RHS repeat-associated protein